MIIKSQIVLVMYDKLINHKQIYMNEIINEYNISVRTFRRYISEINSFFWNSYKNLTIHYDHLEKCYYLTSSLSNDNIDQLTN